jgi:hypothetical protein
MQDNSCFQRSCEWASFEFTCHNDQINVLMVKLSLAVLSGFAVIGVLPGSADDVLPPRFNFDRYTRMLEHSPFAIATAAGLPQATPDFAKDLYVANAAHSSLGDMATIMSSSDHNFKEYLNTKELVDGYSIASIEWSQKVGATKVTIGKDGKFATITFNQALLSQQAPLSALRAPGQPIAAIPSPFVQRSVAQQVPRPHTRGLIQRDPKAAVSANPATPIPELIPDPNLDLLAGVPESVPLPAPNPGVAPPNLAPLPTSHINLSGAPK